MFDVKNFLLDLFFPVACVFCEAEGSWLCSQCRDAIVLYESDHNVLVEGISRVCCAAPYSQPVLEKALHHLKYDFIQGLSEPLGELLIRYLRQLEEKGMAVRADIVVAVPLSAKRFRWRGFNQSGLLAKIIANEFAIEIAPQALVRIKHHRPQVGLSYKERKRNVENVFSAPANSLLLNKVVLLIDDVVTTGSTAAECARLLRASGATKVILLTVSHG